MVNADLIRAEGAKFVSCKLREMRPVTRANPAALVGPALGRSSYQLGERYMLATSWSPRSTRGRLCGLATTLAFLLSNSSLGQSPPTHNVIVGYSGPGQGVVLPELYGQWAGPYVLLVLQDDDKHEIAHAAVLPPDTAETYQRVLFIPRKPECTGGKVEVYIWKPTNPTRAQKFVDSLSPPDGSEDAFCSGHNFLPDGTLAIVGGLNMDEPCDPLNTCAQDVLNGQPYGHLAVRRFNALTVPPSFMATTLMKRERWYPSAIGLNDGDLFIAGHGTEAEPNAPDPNPCPPTYPESNFQTFDRFNWLPPAIVPPATTTISRRATPNCAPNDPLIDLGDYPRLHLLSTGQIVQTNTSRTQFLDIKVPACGAESRWNISATAQTPVVRRGGNSVHIVFDQNDPDDGDPQTPPGTFQPADVIYAIGGTDGSDDEYCLPGGPVHANVAKLVKPTVSSVWVGSSPGQSPPPLSFARYDHNSVLLLDGSILVNGGADGVNCNTQVPALPPELYFPTELFNIDEGSASDIWLDMTPAIEGVQRRYHSVAGLLPDGRVFSAGGSHPPSAWFSVSVYSPPYAFKPRPEITDAPAVISLPPSAPFTIDVTLTASTSVVKRVALVRNGSITHAWDMNQRYVVLKILDTAGQPPNLTLTVDAPLDGFMVPPGYYLLTVVERTHDQLMSPGTVIVPSEGVWVRVE